MILKPQLLLPCWQMFSLMVCPEARVFLYCCWQSPGLCTWRCPMPGADGCCHCLGNFGGFCMCYSRVLLTVSIALLKCFQDVPCLQVVRFCLSLRSEFLLISVTPSFFPKVEYLEQEFCLCFFLFSFKRNKNKVLRQRRNLRGYQCVVVAASS